MFALFHVEQRVNPLASPDAALFHVEQKGP